MSSFTRRLLQITLAAAAGTGCMFINDNMRKQPQSLVSTADARVGRPLTPVSYAGVARRTTRRAVAVGAAATAKTCVQAVDAYGRVYTRCY
jgi:hypothetical protein